MPIPSLNNPFTLTYSEGVEGWPSFYTFYPEYIKGMNGFLYTFQNGNIYRHNTSPLRNNYYGIQGSSQVTSVFNPEPSLTIKLFKTLSFESNAVWNCTSLLTDLSQGNVAEINFEQKEGEWFAYVRHNTGVTNFALRYSNGLGTIASVAGNANALVCSFNNKVKNPKSALADGSIENDTIPIKPIKKICSPFFAKKSDEQILRRKESFLEINSTYLAANALIIVSPISAGE